MDSRMEQLQHDKQAVGQVASKDKEVINCVCMKQNFSFCELNRGLGGNRKKKSFSEHKEWHNEKENFTETCWGLYQCSVAHNLAQKLRK